MPSLIIPGSSAVIGNSVLAMIPSGVGCRLLCSHTRARYRQHCTRYLITSDIVLHFGFSRLQWRRVHCWVVHNFPTRLCGARHCFPGESCTAAHWNVEAFMLTFGTQGEWQSLPLHHDELFSKPIATSGCFFCWVMAVFLKTTGFFFVYNFFELFDVFVWFWGCGRQVGKQNPHFQF